LLSNEGYTFPFKVAGDSGLEKDFDEFSTVHDVLGDKIDVPVSIVAEVFVGFLFVPEEFPEVGEVDRCSFATIERVPVDVENLLAWMW
jgi:hypothetical protein